MKSIIALTFTVALLQQHVVALQVTPGSTCASLCLDNPETDPLDPKSSNTTPSDITCHDDEYGTLSTGIKYKNCTECLQTSNATSENESDASWFLYNVRYAVDVCVFGFQNATKGVSSPCDINYACQPLKAALGSGNLNPAGDQYEYCSADGGIFTSPQLEDCIQCFSSSTSQGYMSNFMTALKAGCQQRPEPGALLGLSGSLFSSSQVNITDPPVNEMTDKNDGSTAMTTGAIVGIAVGAALLFLGGTALFWVYHRKQKRMYGEQVGSHYDPRSGSKSISPPLHGGFTSIEPKISSQLSDYEIRAQQAYTNNADYYSQLEKEIQTRRPTYNFDPNNPGSGARGALPTHPAYLPRAHNRQPSQEPSPQPVKPIKSNKPDSYALQAYLSAAEDANALSMPPPPPGPPPAADPRGSSQHRGASPSGDISHSRGPSLAGRGPSPDRRPLTDRNPHRSPTRARSQTSPLPPPPRGTNVPSLVLPSVPRIRVPKQYAPPAITIEGATPVDGPSRSQRHAREGDLPIGIEISGPIVDHEARFVENPFGRGKKKAPPPPLIVEQTAVDRRPRPWVMEEVEIKTGKSDFYG